MENKKEAILKKHGIYPGFKSTYGYEEIKAAMDEHSASQNEELRKGNEDIIKAKNGYIGYLENIVKIDNEKLTQLQSTIDEKNKEIERLKGLLIAMFKFTPRYNDCGSPATAMAELNRFKTENNL